jgi:hypothetical protein
MGQLNQSTGKGLMEMNLTSNQENTDFYGRSLNGASIQGKYGNLAPPRNSAIHLGRGKFVNIDLNQEGVYEIFAKAPGYIEKSVTIAPPISSRMSFTFEISEKTTDASESSSSPQHIVATTSNRTQSNINIKDSKPPEVNSNDKHQEAIFKKTVSTNAANSSRQALIIGNGAYQFVPKLTNPENDASDMSIALKSLGFNVTTLVNANQKEMDEAIEGFGRRLTEGSVGLFFYAGHGVQVNGENYLLPVDSNLKSEAEVRYKTVNLGQILGEMGNAKNGMNIVILDACRDNPLPKTYRSATTGLAEVDAPKGTLVGFATAPGSTALDGNGRNGVYTKHILQHIKDTGLPVEQVLKKVLQGVNEETDGKQTPWMSSSFTGDFYFNK